MASAASCDGNGGHGGGGGAWDFRLECVCGAGLCTVKPIRLNPRFLFVCCPRGQADYGGCGFMQWRDTVITDNISTNWGSGRAPPPSTPPRSPSPPVSPLRSSPSVPPSPLSSSPSVPPSPLSSSPSVPPSPLSSSLPPSPLSSSSVPSSVLSLASSPTSSITSLDL